MNWVPKYNYFAESGCSQYRVSLAYVRGVAWYTAWHRAMRGGGVASWLPILNAPTRAAARRACKDHARRAHNGKTHDRHEEYET